MVVFTAPAVILMTISAQIALRVITGGYGLIAEHEAQETRQDRGNRPGGIPPVSITIINKSVSAFKVRLALNIRARMANPKVSDTIF